MVLATKRCYPILEYKAAEHHLYPGSHCSSGRRFRVCLADRRPQTKQIDPVLLKAPALQKDCHRLCADPCMGWRRDFFSSDGRCTSRPSRGPACQHPLSSYLVTPCDATESRSFDRVHPYPPVFLGRVKLEGGSTF
jgi:hypothetical protein